MNAIIEKNLEKNTSKIEKWLEFNDIIATIYISKNADDLHNKMHLNCPDPVYFKYGFGGNHMWLHEKGNSERLLLVDFDREKTKIATIRLSGNVWNMELSDNNDSFIFQNPQQLIDYCNEHIIAISNSDALTDNYSNQLIYKIQKQ